MFRNLEVFNMSGTSTDFYNAGGDSSSDEEARSSDEDIDDFLQASEESDSDSFEKEMEMELNKEFLEQRKLLFKSPATEQGDSKEDSSRGNTTYKTNVYDEAYFSSGSEDEDNVGGVLSKSKERRTVQTDEELMYDPNMDEENENWVKQQREAHQGKDPKKETTPGNDGGAPSVKTKTAQNNSTCAKSVNSDAILSCPACLTTLCIDCQRHDIYKQQFRAMFVMNCNIMSEETLRYEEKKHKKKPGKKKQKQQEKGSTSAETPETELYNPVQCASCNTEVAVYDKDEIYHFFNVVESLS